MSDSKKDNKFNLDSKYRRSSRNRRNRNREVQIDSEADRDWRNYRSDLDPDDWDISELLELELI